MKFSNINVNNMLEYTEYIRLKAMKLHKIPFFNLDYTLDPNKSLRFFYRNNMTSILVSKHPVKSNFLMQIVEAMNRVRSRTVNLFMGLFVCNRKKYYVCYTVVSIFVEVRLQGGSGVFILKNLNIFYG